MATDKNHEHVTFRAMVDEQDREVAANPVLTVLAKKAINQWGNRDTLHLTAIIRALREAYVMGQKGIAIDCKPEAAAPRRPVRNPMDPVPREVLPHRILGTPMDAPRSRPVRTGVNPMDPPPRPQRVTRTR